MSTAEYLDLATAREDLGAEVPAVLAAHRRRMFERHLAWPIQL